MRGYVDGPAAADAEIVATRLHQYLDFGLPGSGGGVVTTRCSGRPSHCARLRQVEVGETLGNGIACASSPVSRARFFLFLGDEAVGTNDGGALLALADIAAKAQRLAKRPPALDREAVFDHGTPEFSTLIPESNRLVVAFFGMASGAFAAAVLQGSRPRALGRPLAQR